MKRAITILVCVLAAAIAGGQSPNVIQNTKDKMDAVRNQGTQASNEALGITGSKAATAAKSTAKPGAAAPSPASTAAKVSAGAAKKSAASQTAKAAKPVKASPTGAVNASPMVAKAAPAASSSVPGTAEPAASDAAGEPDKDNAEGKWAKTGKRDPFVSPVVYQSGKSNCTTGKKCLEIGAVNLRGVVRSESGYIAVVTNSLNKAYFLRENDPVFDGYVVKITGDSIVFQETLQDRLGKAFTREVVKKITTPSV